ncbi:MAG TPA: TonB-dependent receptor [Steroidobacteraceae bacterium]|nr:TonB-dependent receptor [Steroidobacteraceae bacterium]
MANSNRTKGLLPLVIGSISIATGASAADQDQSAAKAEPAGATTSTDGEELSTVEVTGYRLSLRNAIEVKRNSDVMMDAINAEDIADFPDANLAESLQRLPGIALDRENGEGKQITVRGLGSDFTRIRLNGLETLSTGAASDSGSAPNRSRGFDFNVFASDLFSSLQVRKTASANTDEGSLGATVDLVTGKPLDYKDRRIAFSAEDAFYENEGTHNPRMAALFADQFFDHKLGISASIAYSDRDSEIDRFRRQPGQPDLTYRNSSWTGAETPQRAGFAAPAGTTFGTVITNPAALAAQTGSDAAAYAALYPAAYSTAGRFDDSRVRIPSLINIEQQDLTQERLGGTFSVQWRPTETTNIGLDGVYSKFDQQSDVNQIQSVGLNRNNTNATFNTGTANIGTRRNAYTTCTPRPGTQFIDAIDCGGSEARPAGVFAGLGTTSFSTNPNNLEPYDYYNTPGSVGYGGATAVAAAGGMFARDQFIGRPGVDVLAAHVSDAGTADYLELRNVDWRSATDASYFTTKFQQVSLNLQQEIGDQLKMDVLYGRSRSANDNEAFLVEFNRMDSPETFVYDERAHGDMPLVSYGFDLANPNNWSLVKNFSAIRHFQRETDNDYQGGHVNFDLRVNDTVHLEFGGTRREYKFKTNQGQRLTNEVLNPSLLELGVTAADLGRVYDFGQGLDLPEGTPTSFFAPNLDAFREITGFDCNCVNKWADWRLSYTSNPGNQFGVDEYDSSYFLQVNFDTTLFDHRLFGNVGQRNADTRVVATGFTTAVAATGPRPLEARHSYTDDLPSANLAFEINDKLLLRAGWAKVMARPLLANLAPTITAVTTPTADLTAGTVTVGNPKLSPFRAKNTDISLEWYFSEGGLLSAAWFKKEVSNYPQTISTVGTIQELLSPAAFQAFLETQTPQQQAWLTNGGPGDTAGLYAIRQFQDAPGGEIKGYEISYQQDFTFLPGWLKNFGLQANYTKLDSSLSYILDPGAPAQGATPARPQVLQDGPFLGASPKSANATLYYETPKWSARVSWAYRDRYVTTYPLAAGTCDPGACDSPLINDFIGSEATSNFDAAVKYQATDWLQFTIEALNLTNQTENRWAYEAEPLVTQYSSTGRQVFAGFRLSL